jgi:hypothetical protein
LDDDPQRVDPEAATWANSILPDAILKDFNSTRILAFRPSDLRIFA